MAQRVAASQRQENLWRLLAHDLFHDVLGILKSFLLPEPEPVVQFLGWRRADAG